jgi:chromosomal replication initiation ATPase DnaA
MSEIDKIRFGFVKPKKPKSYKPPKRNKMAKIESIEYIQEQVAEYFDIPIEELIGRSRKNEYMIPRHTSIALCDALLPHTMVCIASHHGDRDHATGINSRKQSENMIFTDPTYRKQFKELRTNIEIYFGIN